MRVISAHEAKARFGQLLDAARDEPVMIEKHGRGVAVVMSRDEYEAVQDLKLQHLRAEIQKGMDDLAGGRFEQVTPGNSGEFAESIKASARLS